MRVLLIALLLLATACATNPAPAPAGITAPVLIHKVEPEYPLSLREAGVSGIVSISAVIDETGRMVNPRVVRSSDSRLDDLALAAVREWRWRPGTMNGQPVPVVYSANVSFTLHR